MRALESLFISRPARIGISLLRLILGGLGVSFAQRFQGAEERGVLVPAGLLGIRARTDERYPERPAALAASDTPARPN
jgi:hypothetical protein